MIRFESIYDKMICCISRCILLAPLLMLFIVCGCISVQHVPVETTKTDSVYLNKLVRDSIIIKDSVYIKEKGDTIYQYKYKYIYKDKAVHDTMYVERVDSISVPYPVESQLTKWQQTKMKIGGYVVVIVVVLLVILIGRFIYRIRR